MFIRTVNMQMSASGRIHDWPNGELFALMALKRRDDGGGELKN